MYHPPPLLSPPERAGSGGSGLSSLPLPLSPPSPPLAPRAAPSCPLLPATRHRSPSLPHPSRRPQPPVHPPDRPDQPRPASQPQPVPDATTTQIEFLCARSTVSSGRTEFRFTSSSLRARAGAGGQGEADRSSPRGKRAVGEVGWRVAGSCRGVGRLSWRRATALLPHPVSPQVAADIHQLATCPPPADRRPFPPPPPLPCRSRRLPLRLLVSDVVLALPARGPMQRVARVR